MMAIKVSNVTAIDDSRGFFPNSVTGLYSNLHPTANVNTTSTINFNNPVQSITMSSNTTYSTTSLAQGKQLTVHLDRSATGYTPTFGSEVIFAGGTPSWSNRRYWLISFTCWNSTTIRATALGFDAPGTQSSTFTSSWNLNTWDTREYDFGTSFEQAWCWVRFQHVSASNKVLVEWASGNTQAMATTYSADLDYTGMTSISSVEAQYNGTFSTSGTTNQATYGPRPQDDGYTSGTYYSVPSGSGYRTFGWMAANNPNFNSDSEVSGSFTSPAFRVKLVANEGTFYSTASVSIGMLLRAHYGNTPGL